jgi:hypothetical protein
MGIPMFVQRRSYTVEAIQAVDDMNKHQEYGLTSERSTTAPRTSSVSNYT